MKLKTTRTPSSIAAAAVIALIVAALLFYVLYCSVQYQQPRAYFHTWGMGNKMAVAFLIAVILKYIAVYYYRTKREIKNFKRL